MLWNSYWKRRVSCCMWHFRKGPSHVSGWQIPEWEGRAVRTLWGTYWLFDADAPTASLFRQRPL